MQHIVAGKNRLQGHRGLRPLIAGYLRVQRRDHLGGGGVFVRQVLGAFEQFGQHAHAGLQTLGRAELVEQPLLQRHFLGLIKDGFALLERHLKMPVLFQLPLGRFPPLFPIIPYHLGHQRLLNLLRRGPAPETVEH